MLWLTCCFVLLAGAQQAAQPRDVPPAGGAGGVIRGRVTAAATGLPLHRVRITLSGPTTNPPETVTDIRGQFELTDVPAGAYSLTATRAGYLSIKYGQRRLEQAGRTLDVRRGETLERIDIALSRGAVLAGRLLDELGEPAAGVRVEALEFKYIRGRRIAVPARIATTNDIGEYRLSRLPPGVYQLLASTSEVWESEDRTSSFAHVPTYYPGVTAADQPQTISLNVGQEVGGLDWRLAAGRTARITGVVEDAAGSPVADQAVNLDEITRTIGGSLMSAGFGGMARTDARGAFEISKLAPGEYNVYTGTESARVSSQVVLNDGEVKHLVLSPKRPTAINGTIVTDDGQRPPFSVAIVRVVAVETDSDNVLPVWGAPTPQQPRADWTFRILNAEGPTLFRLTGLPDDWMVQRVLVGGSDVVDSPVPVRRGDPDMNGVQIVVSRKGGKLIGDVVDASGAPAADSTIVLFPENPALWTVGSRFIKSVRPDAKGQFSISALPAGAYRLIAKDVIADGQWEDADFLRGALRDSMRVEIGEGASETVKLIMEAAR